MKAKEAQNLALTKLYADQDEQYNLNEKFILDTIKQAAELKKFDCCVGINTATVTLPTLLKLVAYLTELGYKVSFTSIDTSSKLRTVNISWKGEGKPNDLTFWETNGGYIISSIFIVILVTIMIWLVCISIYCENQRNQYKKLKETTVENAE